MLENSFFGPLPLKSLSLEIDLCREKVNGSQKKCDILLCISISFVSWSLWAAH